MPAFQCNPVVRAVDDSVPPSKWNEVYAVTKASTDDLVPVIAKLHKNLGHPPNADLIRVLKHGQASPEAIEIARTFECQFCRSQVKPGIALPAQTHRVHEFNHQLGLDVKWLRGWQRNQKVKCLNMVDTASSFQRVVPFFQNETSSLLHKLLSEHWIAWAGPPKELVLDPAQTNMGDPMVLPCEMQGITIRPIAAGAHWQLGKTESHGGWFAHVLDKIIEEHQPRSQEEWLSCVAHAHVKNQMIQVHGHSPHQFVFGRNPHIPEDLLGEPVSVVSATASLTEEAVARSQALRTTARVALAKLQDDRSMRVALLAYPPMEIGSEADQRALGEQLQQPDPPVPVPSALRSEGVSIAPDMPPPLSDPPRTSHESNVDTPTVFDDPSDVDIAPSQDVDQEKPAVPSMSTPSESDSAPSTYGPLRRRIHGKDGPLSLFRPPAMKQQDFVDVMKEVVPELIEQAILHESSREPSSKRSYDDVEHSSPSDGGAESSSSRPRLHETLSVQDCTDLLHLWPDSSSEVFMAEYLKKKMAEELRHSNNPPALQKKIDEGKSVEWQTLLSKPNAVKLHYGKAAGTIRNTKSDRFIGSRFVLTRKPAQEGGEIDDNNLESFTVKGRWCLQGHLDPDLQVKADEGLLKSPTLSQLGRMTLMQILACEGWPLQLGDIKGAFLEAGPLESRFKPLYAHQPPGGIPGVPSNAVIEVLGNVYGQNDAPAAWFREFSTHVQSLGWCQSKLDPCLYTLREDGVLVGIMGVHVDDTALGGIGKKFHESIVSLRQRFPYRKWREGEGEFCGAWYKQSPDGSIHMNMQSFADKLRHTNIPKGSSAESALSEAQVKVLRAVNGSLNWLSSQTRPDLAVQTSLSQQAFPRPTIADFRRANQAIRRAKQEKDLGISFVPIPLKELTVACHSDAAFANVGSHTQAGYIIAFTHKGLQEGLVSSWCPATWRSYRLSRAVSSTLAAESQAMSTASSTMEWLLLLLAETIDGPLEVPKCREALSRRPPMLITDCKSLYDHLHSPSSPTSIEDRRTSIDVVIIRESCKAMQAHIRWVPTNRMLADAFTKDQGDPMDLLRSCLKRCQYQISDEDVVLQFQADEKRERLKRRGIKQE